MGSAERFVRLEREEMRVCVKVMCSSGHLYATTSESVFSDEICMCLLSLFMSEKFSVPPLDISKTSWESHLIMKL